MAQGQRHARDQAVRKEGRRGEAGLHAGPELTRADSTLTPDEWFRRGRTVFDEFVADAAQHGVAPSPALRFVRDDTAPTPYYEPDTVTIGFGMPDPTTIKGRMHFIFAARAMGYDSVDETIEALAMQIQLLVAHETTHHLRHHYEAPIENDFVEEEVVNVVALAWLAEHRVHSATIDAMRDQTVRVRDALLGLSPGVAQHAQGRMLDVAEVLVAQGRVTRERAEELRRLALSVGEPLATVLEASGTVSASDIDAARDAQRECESYFNSRYMANLVEYSAFGAEWLRTYLERSAFPSFADALRAHVLTEDWARAREEDSRAMMAALLRHPADALAEAAADALVPEGVHALVEAAADGRPAVRAAAALAGDAFDVLREMLDGEKPARAAALAALARHPRGALTDAMVAALDSDDGEERRLAAAAVGGLGPVSGSVEHAICERLADSDDRVRAASATALAAYASTESAGALVRALADPAAPVRDAAAEALVLRGTGVLPALERATASARPLALLVRSRLGDATAAHEMRALLDELVPRIRHLRDVRTALGSADELLAQAVSEEERRTLGVALELAGELGSPEAMRLALRALDAAVPELRREAAGLAATAMPEDVRRDLAPLLQVAEGGRASLSSAEAMNALARDPDRLLRELATEPHRVQDLEEAGVLTSAERLVLLRAVPIFAGVEIEQLSRLAEEATIKRHAPGETIFSAGDESDNLYVVVAGRVAIEHGDERARVAEVPPRNVFGEMALISGEPHSSSAVALRATTLLTLGRESFFRVATREPRVLVEVIRELSRRLRSANAAGDAAAPREPAPDERGLSVIWSGSGLHRGIKGDLG